MTYHSNDVLIGLMADQTPHLLGGMLGILKSGHAFVPIDPSYPTDRIVYVVNDCRIETLLTEAKYLEKAARISRRSSFLKRIICLDQAKPQMAAESLTTALYDLSDCPTNGHVRKSGVKPSNLAYVIYTSGSTGRPKGVPISHENLIPILRWGRDYFKLGEQTRALQNLSYCFDFGVFEILTTILFGGTLCFLDGDRLDNLSRHTDFLHEHEINTMHCTPSFLREVIAAGAQLDKLKVLHLGGEKLIGKSIDDILQVVGDECVIYNGYGPTEASVNCSIYEVGSRRTGTRRDLTSVPIGKATANNRIYILDERYHPVPVGVFGEIYVGGIGLTRGYLNQPALTSERFIPNPFGKEAGARLYKTGDRARYLPDGNIEFFGRLDAQVKVRGYRIETGEIEAVLGQHEGVREAVVMAREDEPGNARLVAYIIAAEGRTPGINELRSHLGHKLPEYMMPTAFVMLEQMPLTPNGKIDRRALPAPDRARPALERVYVAPRNAVEARLAEMCSAVLGLERVGVEDNFFELGGHSLLAIQLISRARDSFAVEIPLRSLFETPTVAALARQIELSRKVGPSELPAPIERVARDGELELSHAQQRLWILDQLEPGASFYNLPAAVRLTGRLDLELLRQIFGEIIRRHESLRTTFALIDDRPLQFISPAQSLELPLIDLSGLPERRRSEEVQLLATAEAERPFDLAQGPLLRMKLLRLSEEEHVLLVTMHHIISDGWSMGVLIREVGLLYRAYSLGEASPLPELEIQYADYAAWQRKWLAGEMLQEQLRYWKGQLAGAPPLLELPTDKPRPPIQSHHGAEIRFSLDAELSRALNALGQQEQTTLFMTLLAAFQTLLSRYSGQRDICVGSPIAGRNRTEIEGLIGFFVNTLVLRTDLSGEPTLRELMRRVKEVCLGAYGHQDVPFEKLVEELQPVRQMSQSPLFQVMFVLQNMAAQPAHLPELQISEVEVENRMAKFDLTLIMVETAEGLQGVIEYNTDLFDQRRIERLIEHYKMVLEAMVEDAGQVVSRVPLLRDDERRQLLTGWNETAREYGSHLRLHEHFEAQVERTPHAVALVYDGEQLSYLELNARANKLAHHLQKLGVGPEVLVGVLMERSLEMVVSLLAILKAGGAYVPLDPLYPQERLSFMLADATVSVLLTQRRLREQALAISHPSELICVDDEWAEIAGQCSDNPDAPLMDDNLAYVIFTSGSTGRPKGAMNTHRAICNRLLWMQETYGLTADDRVMQKTPFSFDVSVWEFFWPLMTGARLVIARPGGHQEPAYLINLIRQEQVTTLHFVPSMLQVFLEERGVDKCESLRRVICSGEALSPALEERFFARLDGSELHNLYGPTEAAVDVTSWACERARARHVVPIGRPIANIQTYIVDEWMQAVPVGVAGELCIGGVGLARGYLRRAGMTAEKFVPNPFGAERGERLYRTGDLARYLPDGAIEYLARMDNQVKLRGFRIELGEVEAVLTQHAAVQDAMVLALDDPSKGKRLVAYLIPDRQRARAVRQFLRLEKEGRLAEHASYELPNGMTVMHLNRGETEFLYQEIFAEHSYLKNGIKLREGDCVFDVGANIGLFSLFVKQHCPQARLYAFEPLPPLFEVLKMNMALHAEDVKVFECGLSNETRGETFTFYPHCSIISGQHADAAQEREVVRSFLLHDGAGDEISAGMMEELLSARLESESYECRLKTLSEVMADEGVERIDLLKVDVEKSEMEVLGGIREEDWPKIRQLIVEVHDVEGRLERVKTLLREHGYELTVEQDSTLKETALYNIYALRSAGEECHACNGIFESQPGVDVEPRYGSLQELKREVRAHLKEKLPEYMVPSAFVLLEQWPLTPNGKIDRRALLACEERQEESRADYVAPRTPVEELLAEMCSVVLGLERVGVEDNFFELGGHSLLAIQLISRARDSFAVEIPLRSLFEAPTIARLAEEIEKAREQPGSQPQVPAITPISRGAHRMKRSAIEM